MQQLDHMATFVRVVESGSFSAASDQLNLAKSAVSRRIAELEGHLGVRLINRTTRRFSLTEAGRAYLRCARRLLDDLAETEAAVRGAHDALVGVLKVACPLNFGQLHMGPLIAEFLDKNPEVDLELDVDDRRIDLIEAGLDMGIRLGSPGPPSLIARRFAPLRLAVCASPGYLEKNGTPKDLDDLEANHFGIINSNVALEVSWRFFTEDGQDRVVRLKSRLRATDGTVMLQAACADFGIVVLPTFLLEASVRTGRLIEILKGFGKPERGAYAIYPAGRRLNSKARAFIDFIVSKFGDTPYWDKPFQN